MSTPWLRRAGVIPALTSALDASALMVLRRRTPLAAADVAAALTGSAVEFVLAESVASGGDPHIGHTRYPRVALAMSVAGVAADVSTLLVVDRLLGRRHLGVAKTAALGAGWMARFTVQRILLGHELRQAAKARHPRPPSGGAPRLSVVVPAFCEADRIGVTVSKIRAALRSELGDDFELIVVDDGSADDTAAAARAAGADQVVENPVNLGKGASVRAGMLAATGRVRAFTDADLAYDPDHLLRLLHAIENGADVAIGNRRHRKSRSTGSRGRVRDLASSGFNLLTRPLLVGGYADTQAGIKAFRGDTAVQIFSRTRVDGFAFDVEVLHLAERYGSYVVEVPVAVNQGERSTVRVLPEAGRVVRDTLRMRRWAGRGLYDEARP